MGKAIMAILAIGLLLLFIVALATTPAPQPTQSPKAKQSQDASFTLAVLGARTLKKAARDPESFKLVQVLAMANGSACYDYRARNGFGGLNAIRAVATQQGRMKTSEEEGFTALWKKECAGKNGIDKTWVVNYAM